MLFEVIKKGVASFLVLLSFGHRRATGFSKLVLYSATLLKVFISFWSLLVGSLESLSMLYLHK